MATFKWDCPHPKCRARQAAYTASTGHFNPKTATTFALGICPVCNNATVFLITTVPAHSAVGVLNGYAGNPFDRDPVATTVMQQHGIQAMKILATLPPPPQIVTPANVPANVKAAFEEGLLARDANLLPSAVYNLRKALERAIKERDAEGKGGLKARIRKLGDDGKIPSTLVELAHTVRAEGNVEAHEDEAWSQEQVTELVDFAVLLFTYLYSLPARIEAIAQHRGAAAGER